LKRCQPLAGVGAGLGAAGSGEEEEEVMGGAAESSCGSPAAL
jgi:hypothetical protein